MTMIRGTIRSSCSGDVADILRSMRNIMMWSARACLYPYAFLLGIVTVVVIFQLINIVDPPYVIKSKHGIDEVDYDDNPAGPPPRCNWNVHIFDKIRTLNKASEFTALMSKLKKVTKYRYATGKPMVCKGDQGQIPCYMKITVSLNETDLRNKDAVVFGMSAVSMREAIALMMSKRRIDPDQLWVFMTMLSPLEIKKRFPRIGSFPSHITWSYLTSSDVVNPYAQYSVNEPTDKFNVTYGHYVRGKRKLVAWMGDNCGDKDFWPRKAYLAELMKHVPVDLYGECTNLTCLPRNSEQCGMLMSQYKFFLAFESSECREYITEPFWFTALKHQSVPIVYGPKKDSYLKLAPPLSFIHISDFESPQALANYLKSLDKNDGLYSRFFKWRHSGSLKPRYPPFKPESLCKLLPYIEDMKIRKFEKEALSNTKWLSSCRNKNITSMHSLSNWTPWK
ncbi:3-galactosyl-N-acetylglucosaminide 4-alpha-L-fucosyltransferase FUT3-like [Lytechinus pictus]|uniref:3-galactosyl-N-acetylglucosaminide 4-alpha-L-fucosyltransferase FUT3-like n=1 Tax=Lytechinus pictus TaxID=7653 RepID=UPI0030B9ED2D